MAYCTSCGSPASVTDKYCRECGSTLQAEPREAGASTTQQRPPKPRWRLALVGVLVVGLLIGGVLLIGKHGSVRDPELAAAKTTLDTYLAFAVNGDKAAMWDMVHPDSKAMYRDFRDFASNNGVTDRQIVYFLADWRIESAGRLGSWKGYPDVITCKVRLSYELHTLADILDRAFLGGIAPSKQTTRTTLFLVRAGDDWYIFSEHSSNAATDGSSTGPDETASDAPTDPDAEADIPTITARELISDYTGRGMLRMHYKGQVINVTGVVKDVSSSSLNLEGPHSLLWVSCAFEVSHLGQLSGLSKGETITVQGMCTGGGLFGPTLNDCRIVG